MPPIRVALTALALGLTALPASADGLSFDLPRLNFPAPASETTRDCVPPLLPVTPGICTPQNS